MNKKETTIASFIDLRKAFDTINHEILLSKLPSFGMDIQIISWIGNYLTNRKQKCSVNGKTSDVGRVTCGVPQGSILGPLLFLLYINDIDTDLLHSNVLLYADDTVLYSNHDNEAVAHAWMTEDLAKLTTWFKMNQLTVNIEKTKIMMFGTRNMLKKSRSLDVYIAGTKLKYVNFFNYLGIKLDNTLTFEKHAAECIHLVSHKLYLLSRVRKYISIGQAISIYKSKIVPYFDYGDVLLINISRKIREKLQRLQNRALRICLTLEGRSNVNDMHNQCNINKLEDRRSTHLLNFVYTRSKDPDYINLGGRELRKYDAPILTEIKSNNKSFERSVLYQGAKAWNALDYQTRITATSYEFKKSQKCKLNTLFPYRP